MSTNTDSDKQWAVISIKDDGSGMSSEFIAQRLFKPFDTTKGNAGMGIGAYDAKQFIHECGGSINVHSEINEGTEFVVNLPINVKD
jgi:signal transduction histidine kinase